ncbi:hypothetical protein F2Q69_00006687 [Brassica cretica]|uniref:Uncharacterized protein n=1 Tax=Brassica cretica TaxID=69181 RepID=A0A8S9P4C2_BRACR|nr:hypothetical protein F2Q69_00006687 [Brassica cretica]
MHFVLLTAVRGSSKCAKSGMGSASRSLGQGSRSRTGGGGGAALVLPVSNLLSFNCNQSSQKKARNQRIVMVQWSISIDSFVSILINISVLKTIDGNVVSSIDISIAKTCKNPFNAIPFA